MYVHSHATRLEHNSKIAEFLETEYAIEEQSTVHNFQKLISQISTQFPLALLIDFCTNFCMK
jgi:ABC-type multidrug transport system permease subunit